VPRPQLARPRMPHVSTCTSTSTILMRVDYDGYATGPYVRSTRRGGHNSHAYSNSRICRLTSARHYRSGDGKSTVPNETTLPYQNSLAIGPWRSGIRRTKHYVTVLPCLRYEGTKSSVYRQIASERVKSSALMNSKTRNQTLACTHRADVNSSGSRRSLAQCVASKPATTPRAAHQTDVSYSFIFPRKCNLLTM